METVNVDIPPGERRGAVALAVEGNRWIVTLVGILGERPPTDLDGFVEYARTLWARDVHAVIADAEAIGEASTGAFPVNVRRRYDRLRRFPGRYIVTSDAACSLNPIYAQGMTVAFGEALTLARLLDRHGLDRVGPRFFRQTRPITGVAWSMATGADLGHPGVEGPRTARWRLLNAYIRRVFGVAHRDPVVADAALKVLGMVSPPQHLMQPRIAWRVLTGGRDRGLPVAVSGQAHNVTGNSGCDDGAAVPDAERQMTSWRSAQATPRARRKSCLKPNVNGVRALLRAAGSGEPLALVHGAWGDATAGGSLSPAWRRVSVCSLRPPRPLAQRAARDARKLRRGRRRPRGPAGGARPGACTRSDELLGGNIALRLATRRPDSSAHFPATSRRLGACSRTTPKARRCCRRALAASSPWAGGSLQGDHEGAARQFVDEVAFGPRRVGPPITARVESDLRPERSHLPRRAPWPEPGHHRRGGHLTPAGAGATHEWLREPTELGAP